MVDEEMVAMVDQRIDSEVPKHAADFKERFVWVDLLRSLVLTVNVNTHSVDIGARLETVLEK